MTKLLGRAVLVLVAASMLAGGCAKQDEGATGDAIEVVFWHAMGGTLGDTLDELIDEFNKTHPGIHVTSVSMGRYQALSQKIMAAVAAGQPPDLAQAYEAWTAGLIENESVIPLDDLIRGPNGLTQKELDDFVPGMIENNTWDGKVYSFPFNKSVRAIYWNKDLFYEDNLRRAPYDWDEYLAFAKRLTKDLDGDGEVDQWGTGGQISVWQFENLLLQNGGQILSDDGSRVAFNSIEGVRALGFLVELMTLYGKVTSGYEYQNDFLAGKVAMIEGSTVSLSFMANKYTFDMAMAALPEKEKSACIVAGTNVVIFADSPSEKQEAAWEFVKWFTGPETTARWAIGTGYVPVRQSALKSEAMEKRFDEVEGLRDVLGQLEYASYEPRTPEWYAGRKYLEEMAVESVLRRRDNPKHALNDAAKAVNALLQG